MRAEATAQQIPVGVARYDPACHPWQYAPGRRSSRTVAFTPPSRPANPSAATATPRALSAASPPDPTLSDGAHAVSRFLHYSRRAQPSSSRWITQFVFYGVRLTHLTTVQLGGPRRD